MTCNLIGRSGGEMEDYDQNKWEFKNSVTDFGLSQPINLSQIFF
jgi:hypothetical protein